MTHKLLMGAAALMMAGVAQAEPQTYVSVKGGLSVPSDMDYNRSFSAQRVETSFENGYVVIGAVGRKKGNWRGELDGQYHSASVEGHAVNGVATTAPRGDVTVGALMANVYYDVPTGTKVTPYVGAGAGVAVVKYDGFASSTGNYIDGDTTAGAYQGMAGVDYALTNNVSVNAEYRYFSTAGVETSSQSDVDFKSHNMLVGAKYTF